MLHHMKTIYNYRGSLPSSTGRSLPALIYGTAWKENATTELVKTAVASGFLAIDTANQPKHYQEALVGQALADRKKLWLQTKFTPADGQDQRIPYDPAADLHTQVWQSFRSSLKNLQTDTIDSYLLHGPYSGDGLGKEDWEVWGAMEEIVQSGKAKQIGISNVNCRQLELLLERAKIKPSAVQNRCFANRGWDKTVREVCNANGIVYQGFSLLTANPLVWQNPQVKKIAARWGKTPMQVIFRFAVQIGITPLTGTANPQHMKEDLEIFNFELTGDEINLIEKMGG